MLTRDARRADHSAHRDAGPAVVWTAAAQVRMRTRRRDRRARGIRGPLAPRAVPIARSRATRFDDLVLTSWDRLVATHPHLQYIDIAVSDVPEPDQPALSVFDPADAGIPARITVYRWALELRAGSTGALKGLVGDVLTEQAAVFLAMDPGSLDPEYPRV